MIQPHKKFFGGAIPYAFTETGGSHVEFCIKKRKGGRNESPGHPDICNLKEDGIKYEDILKILEGNKTQN